MPSLTEYQDGTSKVPIPVLAGLDVYNLIYIHFHYAKLSHNGSVLQQILFAQKMRCCLWCVSRTLVETSSRSIRWDTGWVLCRHPTAITTLLLVLQVTVPLSLILPAGDQHVRHLTQALRPSTMFYLVLLSRHQHHPDRKCSLMWHTIHAVYVLATFCKYVVYFMCIFNIFILLLHILLDCSHYRWQWLLLVVIMKQNQLRTFCLYECGINAVHGIAGSTTWLSQLKTSVLSKKRSRNAFW